ncbi:hypothetical protein V6N13_023609 [Hibiscus sabdariffa]|uniref:Uncharacterized protein n=1 Tax=Hibiscus sabdariffa TaxID=183260 RepID=A0ABR2PMD3_9ROSI
MASASSCLALFFVLGIWVSHAVPEFQLAWIGDLKELLPTSRTKANVDVAGRSQLWQPWKGLQNSKLVTLSPLSKQELVDCDVNGQDQGGADFQHYESGVFTGECGTSLDYGVTTVGMQRDVAAEEGLCGIAMEVS